MFDRAAGLVVVEITFGPAQPQMIEIINREHSAAALEFSITKTKSARKGTKAQRLRKEIFFANLCVSASLRASLFFANE